MLGLAISKGLRFIGVVLCIRYVGNYTWGQTTSTIAIFSFLTFFIDQGLGSAPLLFHLQNRAADKRLLLLLSLYRVSMAFLFIAVLYITHSFIHSLDRLILIYSFVLIPRALSVDWWFLRRELYQITLYIGSVRTLLFFFLVLLFVRHAVRAETIIYIEMASESVSVAFGYLLLGLGRPAVATGTSPQFGIQDLLKFSSPFLIIGLLSTVQASMDVVFLKFFRGNEMVAQYDIGTKIGFLYFFIGATIIQIIRPKLTRLYLDKDIKRMGVILRTTSAILLLLSSILLMPSLYFPSELIGLFFNKNQELTVFVFRWVALWVSISFMTMLCSDTLLSLGKRRDYVRAAWICAVGNISANLILLKLFSGYGAIFAKIISEAIFLCVSLLWLPREIRKEISSSLFLQLVFFGVFIGLYSFSFLFGHRLVWFSLSLTGCLAIVFFGKVFTRETLAVLRDN